MKHIDTIVNACIDKGYVTPDKAPWLYYALEKRITSIIAFVPLIIIGFLIAAPTTVLAFFATFCVLRSQTNGFHAKTVGRCLLYSILGEAFFLKVLPFVWNDIIAFTALSVSFVLIWHLAPYNHPNMELSSAEIACCAKSAKKRLCILCIALCVFWECKQEQLVKGVLLGVLMTAVTLVIAYLIPEK